MSFTYSIPNSLSLKTRPLLLSAKFSRAPLNENNVHLHLMTSDETKPYSDLFSPPKKNELRKLLSSRQIFCDKHKQNRSAADIAYMSHTCLYIPPRKEIPWRSGRKRRPRRETSIKGANFNNLNPAAVNLLSSKTNHSSLDSFGLILVTAGCRHQKRRPFY